MIVNDWVFGFRNKTEMPLCDNNMVFKDACAVILSLKAICDFNDIRYFVDFSI